MNVGGPFLNVHAWSGMFVSATYRITFETGAYHRRQGQSAFYPRVEVLFRVDSPAHFHIPLLLSPFGYSTYRGS